ncbi:tetratricopeptide repeat protein [Caenimonas terrae]|uniref:Tetratricopeptide repeat protein n=1 Tax=Caenimonas terrae TaxID=696074 RepID=A0ABW0NA30_9BURK
MGWLQDKLAGLRKPAHAAPAPPAAARIDWRARGNAALAAGQIDEAARCYQQAVDAEPGDPLARLNHGFALMEQARFGEAATRMREALALERRGDGFAHDAQYLLGRALLELGQPEQAVAAFEAAAGRKPGFLEPLADAILTLHRLGRHDEAAQWARQRSAQVDDQLAQLDAVLRANPASADAAMRRVSLLIEGLRLPEAVVAGREALRHCPDDPELHWALSMACLLLGDFAAGWSEHEWRLRHPVYSRKVVQLPQPRWQGETLQGRTIFLHAEQGFGDSLQFIRFLPDVAGRAGTVLLHLPPQLIPLVADSLAPNCTLVDEDAPLPAMDFQLPLMSLPLVLGTTPATVPAAVPYVHADPGAVARWRERLGPGGLRVGITWSGNAAHVNDRNRSIALEAFRDIAVDGCRFYALQPEVRASDRAAFSRWPGLVDLGPELRDFADTAAVMEALDLIVTVDTSVAHLAGALGRPVWILLPHLPDWRWMLQRSDSPWYPTARLFRQERAGDWSTALARVRADLGAMARAATQS